LGGPGGKGGPNYRQQKTHAKNQLTRCYPTKKPAQGFDFKTKGASEEIQEKSIIRGGGHFAGTSKIPGTKGISGKDVSQWNREVRNITGSILQKQKRGGGGFRRICIQSYQRKRVVTPLTGK